MNEIDKLISELLLDARNGHTGLTDKYRNKFRAAIDHMMNTRTLLMQNELKKLIEHTNSVIDRYK